MLIVGAPPRLAHPCYGGGARGAGERPWAGNARPNRLGSVGARQTARQRLEGEPSAHRPRELWRQRTGGPLAQGALLTARPGSRGRRWRGRRRRVLARRRQPVRAPVKDEHIAVGDTEFGERALARIRVHAVGAQHPAFAVGLSGEVEEVGQQLDERHIRRGGQPHAAAGIAKSDLDHLRRQVGAHGAVWP